MKYKSLRRKPVAVKICGITNLADARLAVENGADALGFNFCPTSPRKIAVWQARAIIRKLPRKAVAVGVFANMPAAEVLRVARTARLGAVQLHGDESPQTIATIARYFPVIKAFRVGPSFDMNQLNAYSTAVAFLLDGFDEHLRGGTGKTFDWSIADTGNTPVPLIVAGGLMRENVRQAIQAAVPCGVDACSGVESLPGKKDAKKMREFLKAVGKRPRKRA